VRLVSLALAGFGAFRDRKVDLAPGLTVVFGPNEAGKSTWHAAAYAALCGMRRGRGQGRDDRAFEERHRPWEGGPWRVGAIVELADRRKVELSHDFEGKAASRAIDLELGRDLTGEILFEGSPDGSRWLGLDRRAFAATACVRQADILAITEEPYLLTEHLQRAAATAGTDATAAAALARLDAFRREHVGRDRAGSPRPLRRAIDAVEQARARLEIARRSHDEYVTLAARTDELEERSRSLRVELAAHMAAEAQRHADDLARRLTRATGILARMPDAVRPDLPSDEALARRAEAALRAWHVRPPVPTLAGESSDHLRERLAGLPDLDEGDEEPHPRVADARDAWLAATHAQEQHIQSRPPAPEPMPSAASQDTLRELVRGLETPVPVFNPLLTAPRRAVRCMVDGARTWFPGRVLAAAGVGLIVAGGAAAVSGRPGWAVGAAFGAFLAVLGLGIVGSHRKSYAMEPLVDLDGDLHGVRSAAERRFAAAARAEQLGLPADPAALRSLADATAAAAATRVVADQWDRLDRERELAARTAAEELWQALLEREAKWEGSLAATLTGYLEACRRRQRQAVLAGTRPSLEGQLDARVRLEQAAAQSMAATAIAEEELRAAAARCLVDLGSDGPEELALGLARWLEERGRRLAERQRDVSDWSELQGLLAGATLDGLRRRSEEAAAEASRRQAMADAELVELAHGLDSLPARIADLGAELAGVENQAAASRGQVDQLATQLPGLPEAEEALRAAEAELHRIQELERVLGRTRQLLEAAQEDVHRDVAPMLAATLRRWMPRITGGRYVDGIVDPQTLEVQVCGPGRTWQRAALLSQGTREQVYLLLRMALVQHLTRAGEVSPLLFDEVTVHSDRERTLSLLRLLHEISATHQVLLFTQEDLVAEWARATLRPPRDTLIELEAPPTAT
jgi:hypothetical protein